MPKIIKWSKQLDAELLENISNGKTLLQINISMNMSTPTIKKRLWQMGFENYIDAKNVMMYLDSRENRML